jgi:hypothetical protein
LWHWRRWGWYWTIGEFSWLIKFTQAESATTVLRPMACQEKRKK